MVARCRPPPSPLPPTCSGGSSGPRSHSCWLRAGMDPSRCSVSDLADMFATPIDDPTSPSTVKILHPGFRRVPARFGHAMLLAHAARHGTPRRASADTAVCSLLCRHYGGMLSFRGRVTTLVCNDSNPLVRLPFGWKLPR
jgi:hypothetical protein